MRGPATVAPVAPCCDLAPHCNEYPCGQHDDGDTTGKAYIADLPHADVKALFTGIGISLTTPAKAKP